MKIFMIWPFEKPETSVLFSELEKSSHEIIYWLGLKRNEKYKPLKAIFHDHYDAWIGIPPEELKAVEFDPPAEELINKMYRAESIALTMMNKHFEGWRVDERKNLYYDMLGYWYGVLNKIKPDAIIFSRPPHPVHSYIIYELAQILKIKTILFDGTLVSGRMVWENNIWEGSRTLLEKIAVNQNKKFTVDDLSEDLRLYLKFCLDDIGPSNVKYLIKRGRQNSKVKIVVKSLRDFTIFKKTYFYLYKLLKDNTQKEYRRFANPRPDLSKKYIYVTLGLQPECTTSPLGGIFVNQILMIKILAASLPKDWVIYVKEHPAQWELYGLNYTDYRYPGYYEKIIQIKNVQLVPAAIDSFSLIRNSQAVAVVSGSAAWEAVLRHKPALVFGYPWFKDCPVIFRINSLESCRAAIKKITDGYRPEFDVIINYLKCLDQASVPGISAFIDDRLQGKIKITEQDCINSTVRVINQELNDI